MLIMPALLALIAGATGDIPQIPYLQTTITVDGQLDEPAWDQALVVDLPFETRPGENTAAPVRTEALLLDNGAALLVAFRAQDPDPGQIRAFLHDRDAAYQDDFVGVVLDTFNDQRLALEFFANPLGAQMDLTNDDIARREDDSWDAIWASAGQITEFGYVVEMEIPYTALRMPSVDGEQTWGVDLLRFYPRSERYRLSNNPQDRGLSCYLCQLTSYRGFHNASPGRDLEITPTLTVTHSEIREDLDGPLESSGTELEPGLDVSWGITPNITLNATLNPDFSQVEADVAQLDVNQTFALFFPEKRPFFLEGADYFNTPIDTVFTRNVADPDLGARITGKVDRHGFGFFIADDTRTNLLLPGPLGSSVTTLDTESLNAALRYRYDVGENSAIGVLATVRDGEDYRNTVAGVDGRFRFSDADTLSFQWLDSSSEYPDAVIEQFDQPARRLSGDALRLAYDHNERDWFSYLHFDDFARDFRADLGFVNQVDIKRWLAGGGRVWHGEAEDWYSRLQLSGDWDITHDQDGQVLEREVEGYVRVNSAWQSYVEIGGGRRDRFWNGRMFEEDFYGFFVEAQPVSGVYLNLFTRFGDQVDFANTRLARQQHYAPQLRWKLGRHLGMELRHTYQRLSIDAGDIFTANQSDFRIAYQFDLRQRLRLTLQYTDIERNPDLYEDVVDARFRQLGTQLIYSYKVNPRTVLFAGYSDSGLETDAFDRLTTNRTLFMKLGYAWEPTF